MCDIFNFHIFIKGDETVNIHYLIYLKKIKYDVGRPADDKN